VSYCRNYLRKVREDAETTLDAYEKE